MLANDAKYWIPHDLKEASTLSWGSSNGEYEKLYKHSQNTLIRITEKCGPISGKIVEFGSGLGILGDILPDNVNEIVMIDHTYEFLAHRPLPLNERCSFCNITNMNTLKSQYFDIAISTRVFYHVDTITAIKIILELGKLINCNGRIIIQGWHRDIGNLLEDRLTRKIANYIIDINLILKKLSEFGFHGEVVDHDIMVFNKLS